MFYFILDSSIPGGYIYILNFGYYKKYEAYYSWEKALLTCERDRSHLVIINSEAEFIAIQNLMTRSSNFYHVGVFDPAKNGTFVTLEGK